jgi:hypothetical protein
MPKLVRLYVTSVGIGFLLSAAFAALLVGFDIGGLQALVLGSSSGWIAGAMLVVSNGILFSGVQFGIRVMMLAERDDTPHGGRGARLIPVPVRAEARGKAQVARRR